MYPREFGKEDPDQLEVDNICFEIVCHTRGRWRSLVYLKKILCYLREHKELCKDPAYQRLYDECIRFLLLEIKVCKTWLMYDQQTQKEYLEKLIDIENKTVYYDKLSKYEVEAYLDYRAYRWNQMK